MPCLHIPNDHFNSCYRVPDSLDIRKKICHELPTLEGFFLLKLIILCVLQGARGHRERQRDDGGAAAINSTFLTDAEFQIWAQP